MSLFLIWNIINLNRSCEQEGVVLLSALSRSYNQVTPMSTTKCNENCSAGNFLATEQDVMIVQMIIRILQEICWRQSVMKQILQEISSPQNGTAGLSGDQAVASPTKTLWAFFSILWSLHWQFLIPHSSYTIWLEFQPTPHRPTDLKGKPSPTKTWILDQSSDMN